MKVIDEKLIDEQAEKFFNAVGEKDDKFLGYHYLNCFQRVAQLLETKSMLNCYLSVLLMPDKEILESKDLILKSYGYSDEGEFNNALFKTDRYIIERIEKTESIFQSYLYYYSFFVKVISMGIK